MGVEDDEPHVGEPVTVLEGPDRRGGHRVVTADDDGHEARRLAVELAERLLGIGVAADYVRRMHLDVADVPYLQVHNVHFEVEAAGGKAQPGLPDGIGGLGGPFEPIRPTLKWDPHDPHIYFLLEVPRTY